MVLLSPFLLLIVTAILFYSPYIITINPYSFLKPPTAIAADHSHHQKCQQLWVFTSPVQKGPCVIFHHPIGRALETINKSNIEFNQGVEVGHP